MMIVAAVLAMLAAAPASDFRSRLPEDEVIYFVLPDRFENGDRSNDKGGLAGDPTTTGFDPAHKGYFHGGDLKGLTKRLDYIQGGCNRVWVAPVSRTRCKGGRPLSRAYHGIDHRLHHVTLTCPPRDFRPSDSFTPAA